MTASPLCCGAPKCIPFTELWLLYLASLFPTSPHHTHFLASNRVLYSDWRFLNGGGGDLYVLQLKSWLGPLFLKAQNEMGTTQSQSEAFFSDACTRVEWDVLWSVWYFSLSLTWPLARSPMCHAFRWIIFVSFSESNLTVPTVLMTLVGI